MRQVMVRLLKHPTAVVGASIIAVYVLAAIFAPYLSPHSPVKNNLSLRNAPPFWQEGSVPGHWLGTDALGRDIFSRILYGGRVSLLVGLLSTGFSMLLGTTLGALAGYFRGALDQLLSRLSDLLLAFPFLIFAIGVMAFLGPGFWNLVWALSFKGWVEFFRLTRGAVLSEKTREYVEAAKALGVRDGRIILRHLLPNVIHSVLVLTTLRVGFFIVLEASLSFLGLGLPPSVPAWGSMINEGRDVLAVAYWVSTMPGIALLILVLAINLLGEGLRDVLDPRLREMY